MSDAIHVPTVALSGAAMKDLLIGEPPHKESKENKSEASRGKAIEAPFPSKAQKVEPSAKGINDSAGKRKYFKPRKSSKADSSNAPSGTKKQKNSPLLESGSCEMQLRGSAAPGVPGPAKTKRASKKFVWTEGLELLLTNIIYSDKLRKITIPASRVHPYWSTVWERLKSERITISQLKVTGKISRMRDRYRTYVKQGVLPWKSDHEFKLFTLWDTIWGKGLYAAHRSQGHAELNTDDALAEDEEQAPTLNSGDEQLNFKREKSSSRGKEDEAGQGPPAGKSGYLGDAGDESTDGRVKKARKATIVLEGSNGEQRGETHSAGGGEKRKLNPIAKESALLAYRREFYASLKGLRDAVLAQVDVIRRELLSVVEVVKVEASRRNCIPPSCSCHLIVRSQGLLADVALDAGGMERNGIHEPESGELNREWRLLQDEGLEVEVRRIQLETKRIQLLKKEIALRIK